MVFDFKKPTVELLGRFQPFHDGHFNLARVAIERVGQVAIMVRDTGGIDASNPFEFEVVRSLIEERMVREGFVGRFVVVLVPNITNVFYGRDVGYRIEKIDLGPELEAISGTLLRGGLG